MLIRDRFAQLKKGKCTATDNLMTIYLIAQTSFASQNNAFKHEIVFQGCLHFTNKKCHTLLIFNLKCYFPLQLTFVL